MCLDKPLRFEKITVGGETIKGATSLEDESIPTFLEPQFQASNTVEGELHIEDSEPLIQIESEGSLDEVLSDTLSYHSETDLLLPHRDDPLLPNEPDRMPFKVNWRNTAIIIPSNVCIL